MSGVLVANRGEVAVRVLRAATLAGMRTVAVHTSSESSSPHVRLADEAHELPGEGPAAYLDGEALVAVAVRAGCSLLHPGYGFLSEDGGFARACREAGLVFVGPSPEVLDLFGDKARAREVAGRVGVPVLPATGGPTTLERAEGFLRSLGPGAAVMVKALAGGGGRGMRAVRRAEDLEPAYRRCRSEAERAFGTGDLYVERLLPRARHVEVQVLGDGHEVACLGDRECSVQRRHQKLVEVAPSPWLDERTRSRMAEAALAIAREVALEGLATVEFLVDADAPEEFFFLETNPRLQVEHTVTEEVTGVDLVATQLDLASGRTLAELGLTKDVPEPRGYAIQARVNAERLLPDGTAVAASGRLEVFEVPAGPGVRVDTWGSPGLEVTGVFDSLLAKVVTHSPRASFAAATSRADQALAELRVRGVDVNTRLLRAVLQHPAFRAGEVTTDFVEEHLAELVDPEDPAAAGETTATAGEVAAPFQATVVAVEAAPGQAVAAGAALVVLEAMKMEHVVPAPHSGVVAAVRVAVGDTVPSGTPLVDLVAGDVDAAAEAVEEVDLDAVRPDLAEVLERHRLGLDEARPDAVERRRRTGHRTARENIAHLCDEGSFAEYGPLVVAAQRQRRSLDDLVVNTPADGLVSGIGTVNGDVFGTPRSQCAVISYDYTVLAGTQGHLNHRKTDRVLELAEERRLPVVLFAEGGGGRPGDTDTTQVAGLDTTTFATMGRLSGLVPTVGVVAGRCFAGNAALLGCCNVIIATEDATIGMGGPAMIEGGGLGRYRPEEVGPVGVQVPNGVVDVLVPDEAAAVEVAKTYLSYFQGRTDDWSCADQRRLRHVVPENRVRAYDVRAAVDLLADTGSVLELRSSFGAGIITALIRVEGRPMGLVANNPHHLGGAIDTDSADKMARFLQLCDAHGLPVVSLCDTPGFMVGPDAERTATVRHFSRLFVIGANLTVPVVCVILRKGYGLGAQAMAGGHFRVPAATLAWPSGEIGGMGLEGAVRLGYRRELEAVADPQERAELFARLLAQMYERGKAISASTVFELDDTIDPADTRRWIVGATAQQGEPGPGRPRRRPVVDTW